jgi:transposase-like protein
VSGDPGQVNGDRQVRPGPQVPERARRRTFTAQYKFDVVAAYDAAPDGQKGAVLRREGLYSSHIVEWRRARDSGALAGLDRVRGRSAADPQDAQMARLNKEKARAYLLGLLSRSERKNSWTIAELAGNATPDGMQRLLNQYFWSADDVRDDLRELITAELGDDRAVLAVDETGFLKKGTRIPSAHVIGRSAEA